MTIREVADRYNAFIARNEVAWDLVFAALAALFVVVGILLDDAVEAGQDASALIALDLALTSFFIAEFTTRFAAARNRRAYLRGHWIDAIAIIPVPAIRALRLARLLRLFRLVRVFAGVFRALDSFERFAAHRTLIALFIAWLAVAVISAAAFYFAEIGRQGSLVHSPVDALWWAIVTLTTVGYGDVYPKSPEGMMAAAALMVVGITLWAAVTGTITSLIIEGRSANVSIPEQIRQLAELERDQLLTAEEFASKKAELLAKM